MRLKQWTFERVQLRHGRTSILEFSFWKITPPARSRQSPGQSPCVSSPTSVAMAPVAIWNVGLLHSSEDSACHLGQFKELTAPPTYSESNGLEFGMPARYDTED
jgi:hypothetical protein